MTERHIPTKYCVLTSGQRRLDAETLLVKNLLELSINNNLIMANSTVITTLNCEGVVRSTVVRLSGVPGSPRRTRRRLPGVPGSKKIFFFFFFFFKMFNGKDSDMFVVIVGQYCSA